jgi:hypothetical protein
MQLNDLDPGIAEEVLKLSPAEQDEALHMLETYYRNLNRARRHEAHLLTSIANGLEDPHGLGRAQVERIRDFVREIVRLEL